MIFKKIVAAVSALSLTAGMFVTVPAVSANAADDFKVNYAEALQKSMFFYEVQQAGVLPEWNEVSWRADSMENDVVPGGWFDAGDHIKFALTNAYTAGLLAWGLIEYGDAVKKAGLYDLYLNNLQWGLDYVVGCDLGDKVVGTIADDAFDHVWWGSAEVYMRKFVLKGGSDPRPHDEITCTSTTAQMAASLAAGYLVFKDEKPDLAANYLKHAESLFKLSDATRDNTDQGTQGGGNYYKTSSFYDDLFYAANFLYMATGDQSYLDKCESDYIPNFDLENQSTERKYTWGLCWDDVHQAAAILYYMNTGKTEWKDHIKKHLDYWGDGVPTDWGDPKRVTYTPDGLAWLMQWGSLRHMANTAWLAKLAADKLFNDDATLAKKYDDWAKDQLDYAFGKNDLGLCYVIGMGDKNPNSVHHRTASGVATDMWTDLGKEGDSTAQWQTEYAHVLYGALEGGPNSDGTFKDEVNSYQNTEVAIDYNAGYTAALCAMIDDYGGEPLADFPPTETPKWDEFFMRACFNQSNDSYTEVKAYAMNHSAWPTRVIKDLSYNYYFDISELIEQGCTIDDVQVKIGNDQHAGEEGSISISDPIQYDGNIYYVKLTFSDGRVVMPTGQSEWRSECQFRISVPDNIKTAAGEKVKWDSSNDYSAQELVQGSENDMIVTPYITMYDGDTLIWGIEPDGTTAQPTEPASKGSDEKTTTEPASSDSVSTVKGDANLDGNVSISDCVTILQYLANGEKYPLEGQALLNADVDGKPGVTGTDAGEIQKYDAGIIKEFK
ncbi:MAG: glycoside hydrolase family 9 protein [Ruminococcus sp.]|nr:glycoside hydrolase family 9 protein [Ruminococcus sp.]